MVDPYSEYEPGVCLECGHAAYVTYDESLCADCVKEDE